MEFVKSFKQTKLIKYLFIALLGSILLAVSSKIKQIEDTLQEDHEKSLQEAKDCLLYTSPSPRDAESSRMPSSA